MTLDSTSWILTLPLGHLPSQIPLETFEKTLLTSFLIIESCEPRGLLKYEYNQSLLFQVDSTFTYNVSSKLLWTYYKRDLCPILLFKIHTHILFPKTSLSLQSY